MKNILLTVAAFYAAAAAGDVLVFGTEDAPVSGLQTVQAAVSATGIDAYVAEGETLVLTNGDITLSAPESGTLPQIRVSGGGSLRIASDLVAPDGLHLKGWIETITQTNFFPQAWNHSPTATLFAANRNIDDYLPVGGMMVFRLSMVTNPLPGYVYNIERKPGEIVFEMQYINDYLRSIKVRLFQDGADIYTQILWARYGSWAYGYGCSLESDTKYTREVPVESQTHRMTQSYETWFGVHSLTIAEIPKENKSCVIAGGVDISGELFVDSVYTSFEGGGELANDLAVPVLLSNAVFRVCRDVETTLASEFETLASSSLILDGKGKRTEVSGAIVTIDTTKINVLNGVFIEDLEITGSLVRQRQSPAESGDNVWFGYNEHTPSGIVFQVQGKSSDGWNKCAIVHFWQEGSNIVAKVIGTPFNYIKLCPLGTDMSIPENVRGQGSYNATNVTYTYVVNDAPINLTGTATNGMPLCVDVKSGAKVRVNSTYALPKGSLGTVTIEKGAEVWWTAGTPVKQYLNRFCVKGKLLYQKAGYRDGSVFDIDGGLVAFYNLGEANSTKEAGGYANTINFSNGGRLIGRRPRIGDSDLIKWTVSGNLPCYSEAGGLMVGKNGNATTEPTQKYIVDVADVTGDEASDFISTPAEFSGYSETMFQDYNDRLMRLKIVKEGAGTWEWNAKAGSSWTGRLVINEGAMRFEKSATMSASGLGVRLDGGELQLASSTSNSIPKFEVLSDSTLRLGDDAMILFPDETIEFASGTYITNDVVLSVYGPYVPDGKRTGVRFGSSECLASETISKIRYNDYYVTQDSEGWLRSASRGTIIFMR